MVAYYNENDPHAAAWLRCLIQAGLIAPGVVDERSIEDVCPSEISTFAQCHFFAGIGVWSYALRQAGWPDDRPVWTGSCPCQPFSSAGKGGGFDDERHLWPAFHWLISQCRPDIVFGEQVAGKAGETWLDLVQADLEVEGYACGAAVTAACGFGAPHQRKRLYWVSERLDHSAGTRHFWTQQVAEGQARNQARLRVSGKGRRTGSMADAEGEHGRARLRRCGSGEDTWCGRNEHSHNSGTGSMADADGHECEQTRQGILPPWSDGAERNCAAGSMADAPRVGRQEECSDDRRQRCGDSQERRATGHTTSSVPRSMGNTDEVKRKEKSRLCEGQGANAARSGDRPGPTNGHWRDVDWLFCRDGKWRPVEPGTFPLVDGAPARVGRLRGYGNAIVAQQAQAFIEAYLDTTAPRCTGKHHDYH